MNDTHFGDLVKGIFLPGLFPPKNQKKFFTQPNKINHVIVKSKNYRLRDNQKG